MSLDLVTWVVRMVMISFGAFATGRGWTDQESVTELSSWVVAGVGILWSLYTKFKN